MNTITRSLPRFPLASLCGLLLIAPAFVQANIVSNPGFEAGFPASDPAPLTDWTIAQNLLSPKYRVDGFDTTFQYGLAPNSGNVAATFYSDFGATGNASIKQALTTSTTETYDLSFYLANPDQELGNTNNFFSVSWDGALIGLLGSGLTEISAGSKTYRVTSMTSWFQVTALGLAVTGASTDLQFTGGNTSWGTLLDDVSVQAASVPDSGSSVALLGIALAGLVFFSRKEQRAAQA